MDVKYNRLTVIETYVKVKPNGKKSRYALCKCDCGSEQKEIELYRVRNGETKSCGCISREKATDRNTIHGMRHHPVYNTHSSMMTRCYNENHKNYIHYGARGITVIDEWHDIHVFAEWCEKNGFDKKLQLDRIDNDQSYSPENCRFVTPSVNLMNTRHNVTIDGVPLKKFLKSVSEEHDTSISTLIYRYYTIKKDGLEINEENLIYNKRWLKRKTR